MYIDDLDTELRNRRLSFIHWNRQHPNSCSAFNFLFLNTTLHLQELH